MLKQYLDNLQASVNQGDAREESYYKHLEKLVLEFAGVNAIKKVEVTVLPKKTEAGNPDFRIWDGSHHITGYIEAKDPSVTNLDRIEESEQLKRYRSTFPNVILTNFYEFRLYREGRLIKKVVIGRQVLAQKLKVAPPVEKDSEFFDLLNTFFSFSLPVVRNAKALATELAKRTRFLRDEVVSIEMAEEERNGRKAIMGFYEAFTKYLIGTLTKESFADLYSQTITYGLFAARSRSKDGFNRELAYKYIPNTIGILRDLFRFISLEDPPLSLQIIVDDIAEVLNLTDVNKILHDYEMGGKGEDPIIHFYETFLTAYDPTIRDKRGVYYTPEPVVGYIVRSINQLLKSHFSISDGIGGENVTLLDPAGGTLTFPAEAIKLAVKEYVEKYGNGGKVNFIRNHILQNFYAFELMMAPYAIGHLKMSFLFEELGYRLADDERFKLYLTNSLELEDLENATIPGVRSLSEESHLAGKVKKEQPLLVVFGNPPYSGMSSNPSEQIVKFLPRSRYHKDYYWDTTKNRVERNYSNILTKEVKKLQKTFIGDILMDYYFVDGNPLGEKNPKWLQDDYVKFLRFAQWKIEQSGFGILGMITNHSYLDNPTFRGMRQSLMNTFNEIYILDLHGNSLKKEVTADGGKDENVFDIRQGTSIVLFVKQKDKVGCQVCQTDLFGTRELKYDWLNSHDFLAANYRRIVPESPHYFFTHREIDKIRNYLTWIPVDEIFPVNSVGVVTARDKLTIRWTENEVWNTVLQFSKMDPEIARDAYQLGPDVLEWQVSLAQEDLKKSKLQRTNIKPILAQPFDIRFTYYTGVSKGFHCRPRSEVMQHFIKMDNNLGLAVSKRVEGNKKWEHAFVTDKIMTHHAVSNKEVNFLFPLYLYKEKSARKSVLQTMILFEPEVDYSTIGRIPNIEKGFYEKLTRTYKTKPEPEEIFHYIYAILYSTIYRIKYSEFLKSDFPRIPFTEDYGLFTKMANFGNQLVDLHLMKGKLLDDPVSKYHGDSANDQIERVVYDENEQTLHINGEKYFEPISNEVWNYQIGGYPVLKKYLKDRKGLRLNDPKFFGKIITVLTKTISIQMEIDMIYSLIDHEAVH
jgi:predicted helicase